MTLIYKLDLDIVRIYLHTKNEVYGSRHSHLTGHIQLQPAHYQRICIC